MLAITNPPPAYGPIWTYVVAALGLVATPVSAWLVRRERRKERKDHA
ncbi:MAG: hypothetical protein M1522_08810 [Actinobacteria bacterium]|jgi:Co/Zn/Cd efflux system component|nr:hypothetical protein [Actinomycetota bacterium]